MRSTAILLAACLALTILAGCAGSSSPSATTGASKSTAAATTGPAGASSSSASSSGPASSSASPSSSPSSSGSSTRTLGLVVSRQSGEAPLLVNFTLSAAGEAPKSFNLVYGDGTSKDGTTLPATLSHSYAAGNFVAKFVATYNDGKTLNRTVSLAALAPAVVASGPLYNKTFSANIPVPWYPGYFAFALCGSPIPMGDTVSCEDQLAYQGYKNGANKTFFVGYTLNVPAGAASMSVEGGTKDAQTCDPTGQVFGCYPDVDVYVFDPTGAETAFATDAPYEAGSIDSPAAGAWNVILVYYLGGPSAGSMGSPSVNTTTHILVT